MRIPPFTPKRSLTLHDVYTTVHDGTVFCNAVVVTAISYASRDYLVIMACFLRQVDTVQFLVVSLWCQHARFCRRAWPQFDIHPCLIHAHWPRAYAHKFGSSGFNLLRKQKVYAVHEVFSEGWDVFLRQVIFNRVLCSQELGGKTLHDADTGLNENSPSAPVESMAWHTGCETFTSWKTSDRRWDYRRQENISSFPAEYHRILWARRLCDYLQ